MTAATNLKFEKSSSALENIHNQQRSQYDKAGIGYSTKQEHTVEKTSSDHQKRRRMETFKLLQTTWKTSMKKTARRIASLRRQTVLKYRGIFIGYCYSCYNFGHKTVNCKAYERSEHMKRRGSQNIECSNCHHFGHIARHCRNNITTYLK